MYTCTRQRDIDHRGEETELLCQQFEAALGSGGVSLLLRDELCGNSGHGDHSARDVHTSMNLFSSFWMSQIFSAQILANITSLYTASRKSFRDVERDVNVTLTFHYSASPARSIATIFQYLLEFLEVEVYGEVHE